MDYFLFQQLNSLTGRFFWLDALGVFFAGYFQYILAMAVLMFFFWQKDWDWRKRFLAMSTAFSGALMARYVLVDVIRWLWFRPRPFISHQMIPLIFHENTGSFPSGHAAFFFALTAVVYMHDKKQGIWLGIGALLIGLARVFVGVHYPADIFIGAVLGILAGWGCFEIYNRFF